MTYFFVNIFITLNTFLYEKFKFKIFTNYFILILPAFFIFTIFPSMQLGVGTDYFTYLEFFNNKEYYYFCDKSEYVFCFAYYIIDHLNIPHQFLFFFSAFVNGLLFFYGLYLLSESKFKIYIITFIFLMITGSYQNQMNGLRQFVGVFSLIPLTILFLNKRYLLSLVIFTFAVFSHKSFLMILFMIFLIKIIIEKINYKKQIILVFIIFSASPLIYYLITPLIIRNFLEITGINYASYIEYEADISLFSILSKSYYLPIYLFFFFKLFSNKIFNNFVFFEHRFSIFFLMAWASTTFYFLSGIEFPIANRLNYYFQIFNLFPIYFLISYYTEIKSFYANFVSYLFITIPFILKSLVFYKMEYDYRSIMTQWIS